MVMMILGLPGSGKSYFAERLAKKLNADYVNSDRVRKEMYATRNYSPDEKESVYNEMLARMKESAQQNRHVVLDGTFHKSDNRKRFVKEMEEKGGIYFMEIQADEKVIRKRLKKERRYSEADFEVYKFIREHNEPLTEPHLLLQSTDDNIDDMIQKASTYLKSKHDDNPGK